MRRLVFTGGYKFNAVFCGFRQHKDLLRGIRRSRDYIFAHGLGSSHFELKPFMNEFAKDYVNQFGCSRIKRIVSVDMTPYMRNTVWEGGLAKGTWTDDDFLRDLDRVFDDVGFGCWEIAKVMNPALAKTPKKYESSMTAASRENIDPLTFGGLWYSLFRTDQRGAMQKITVPFLYVMPENGLYSMVTADFIREHVKGGFVLEKNFPGTTHLILMEKPRDVAERVKAFMKG